MQYGGSFSFTKNLHLKLFIEGYYASVDNQMRIEDTVRAYLHSTASPYYKIDSARGVVKKDGNCYFNFSNAANNVNYYIVIKGRNTIETWSKRGGASFVNSELNYNFTTSNSQAYGSNEKNIDQSPIAFGIYSGDVNQDGVVDITDNEQIDNDAFNFATGYLKTDLDGDNFVDISDALIADNNASNFVSVARP